MITELYTKRLYLRKMIVTDSNDLFNIWSNPDVTRYMNISNFSDEKQARDMIQYLDQLSQENKAIRFTIIELESNHIIGSCGFNFLDFENGKTEIGCEIDKKFWGKGYAPEATASLITYAFDTLNLNRIEAKVDPQNLNSIKFLQKLNFIFEGTLRQSDKIKDKFIDLNIYSKLKTD